MANDIPEVIEALKQQPVFQLSLADKELFHSNFLAWLATGYPEFFISVLEKMSTQDGKIICTNSWKKDFLNNGLKVKREYNNFDLCILANGKPVFVLENKNKSIPYLNQLEEYNAKLEGSDAERLLLSLATDIPERKSIEKAGWKIVSYKELGVAMENSKDKLPSDVYPKSLIEDYQKFVSNLAELSEKLLGIDSYFVDNEILVKLADCRLDDLAQKIRYSSFAAKLSSKEINGRKIIIADAKKIKEKEVGTVYANQDYTSRGGATGIIELAVKVDAQYALKIQIQGEKYRHALEWIGDNKCTKDEMTEHLEKYEKMGFFTFEGDNIFGEEAASYPTSPEKMDDKRNNANNKISGYNNFGLGFQYRYVKITKRELKYQDLLDHIIKDLSRFVEF